MPNVEDVERLRVAYECALTKYEGVCATLNRHMLAQTQPSTQDIQAERDARKQLDVARRAYLDTWMLP